MKGLVEKMKGKKTRIIATIGRLPKDKEGFLRNIIRAGVDVIRINMSHTKEEDADELLGIVNVIRGISERLKRPVAILADIMGPKIRLCEVPENKSFIKKGERLRIGTVDDIDIGITNCPKFTEGIEEAINNGKGISINIGDGALILDAIQKKSGSIEFITRNDGRIRTGQGITVRGIRLPSGSYNIEDHPHDIWSVKIMVEHADILALSFVNSAKDIENLQDFISSEVMRRDKISERFGGISEYPVIAKIETDDGVDNIDGIIDRSFGIMVARGDMGLQMGLENVPLAQKDIIRRANIWGKPVIVATQMLASMVSSPEPTRAEVSDVANAIIDGTDALMLSDETAIGKYPIEAVRTLDKIAKTIESSIYDSNNEELSFKQLSRFEGLYNDFELAIEKKKSKSSDKNIQIDEIANFISYSAVLGSELVECDAIVAISRSGATARRIARFKPPVPVIIGTMNETIPRLCSLSYGITAFVIEGRSKERDSFGCLEDGFKRVERLALERGILKKGMKVARIAGLSKGVGDTNFLQIVII